LIRFGSRVDLFAEVEGEIMVKKGDRVTAGETTLIRERSENSKIKVSNGKEIVNRCFCVITVLQVTQLFICALFQFSIAHTAMTKII